MKVTEDRILLSALDLANHSACSYSTQLDLQAAKGEIEAPNYRDPVLAVMQERGQAFERDYLADLKQMNLSVSEPGADITQNEVQRTISAMAMGMDIIYQAALEQGDWRGRADFLTKVSQPGKFGDWSYEVVDAKLAKETKAGTLLQLSLYSSILGDLQGHLPEFMHVMTPDDGFSRQTFRVDDYQAYCRHIQGKLLTALKNAPDNTLYPNPVPHCEICRWWFTCDKKRRSDDHLSLVAGLSLQHINQFGKWDVTTMDGLSVLPFPLQRPVRGAVETYEKLREQARVQVQSRSEQKPVYELLPLALAKGLMNLPKPSPGDIFFDIEGDPYAGTKGLEFLFGSVLINDTNIKYTCQWSFTPTDESNAFENFVDKMIDHWQQFPEMHIYHFGPYEPSTLKRLMGRYASRENEIDKLLRAGLFVDLHSIAKQTVRAGVEQYSLKQLEPYYSFTRSTDLRDATISLRIVQTALERDRPDQIPEDAKKVVEQYNMEDCLSTVGLRDWLESLRESMINDGASIPRPNMQAGDASEKIRAHQLRIQPIIDQLLHEIPADELQRSPAQHANWLLANMLDWYRREEKSSWWELFRLMALTDLEMMEEKAALAGLVYTGNRRQLGKLMVDTYTFPSQDTDIRLDSELKIGDGNKLGTVVGIDITNRIIDIKKTGKSVDIHPASVFVHSHIPDGVKEESIIRLAEWVINNSMDGVGSYQAGRDLLMNLLPRTDKPFENNDSAQIKAIAWANALRSGVLPIQGPPGAGKSHTAAHMIVELVKKGKKIGITALSHKVIVALMEKVVKVGLENGVNLSCAHRVSESSGEQRPGIIEMKEYDVVLGAIANGNVHVAGGTTWMWSRPEYAGAVDYLFVDEAGQLSLIDTTAVSPAATNLILLGDPQQLQQPQQGSHPDGTEVSALEHILKGNQTIDGTRGIFLDETWRMHPSICAYISEQFYENKLHARSELSKQQLTGNTKFQGAGLWFQPVVHEGNQSSSLEETEIVEMLVKDLLKGDVHYIDATGESHKLTKENIMIIAPYNAQVAMLKERMPTMHIGTVDKFQGQEAPIVIFSMATSSVNDAPRGMEFLYSPNRLNVAVSRARATCILVASPNLFDVDCKSPRQMKLANSFCRYLELATQ